MTIARRVIALVVFAVICATGFSSWSQDASDPYVKKDSWSETMAASRAAYLAWIEADQARNPIVLGPWYTTGPLKAANFSDALFPEKQVDLEAKNNKNEPRWNKHEEWTDASIVNLPGDSSVSTYLFRTLTAKEPCERVVQLGSDDGLEVWLNDEKLLSKDVPRGAAPQDTLTLKLAAGENRLLMKVYNQTGNHGFYFAAEGNPLYALWQRIAADFPAEAAYWTQDVPGNGQWFTNQDNTELLKNLIGGVLAKIDKAGDGLRNRLTSFEQASPPPGESQWLDLYLQAYRLRENVARLGRIDLAALRRAIVDLATNFPDGYPKSAEFLQRLDECETRLAAIVDLSSEDGAQRFRDVSATLATLQREALLANPLLDFDKVLLVKRAEANLGLPQNWQGNCALPPVGYDNEIDVFSPVRPDGALTTFFRPANGEFAGDVDLNFDADKLLFSMPGRQGRWQIWEINADGSGLREVTPGEEPDVDNYDACYLPDGHIMFDSTRCFQGVPCVGGGNTVANLCRMDADGQNTRMLCFEQDHDWCPTVLNNGRVLYARWEYSDTPHYFSRILFHMNPDGTNQAEYYGSNSFWPNSTFYARPIPENPTQFVAIISGHHGVPRMGELIVFDTAKGRHEADGVIQRLPGYGQKVEPIIADTLVDNSWPKFLHPYPLSAKYFIVSCKPTPSSLWGIYLVDVFDNMLLLCEVPGYALFEPVPLRKTTRPPVIPDKVRLDQQDATVYLADIYAGQGLKGVPKGTARTLRVYEFHYTYPQMGGHINIGVEGPWDVHRILGTVPILEDGSAMFTVPANTPIAVQPLDAQGRALQVMRSWFVAMPGETLSCVGCHERQNMTPPSNLTLAARHAPFAIEPWRGPARGFSFKRDVQPALDKYCVGCHNGQARPDGNPIPDFSAKEQNGWSNFTPAYLELHPYVRRPGPESDYHLQNPLEFHVSTSELVQMLEKGHHGVKLDDEAWDRLVTWIDLNVPDHGTWGEHRAIPGNFHQRRIDMLTQYANRPADPEAIPDLPREPIQFVQPDPPNPKPQTPSPPSILSTPSTPSTRTLDLGNGVTMDLTLVPAGSFVMGSADGCSDEMPPTAVEVAEPFWMGVIEVTNDQFQQFDPAHDSGYTDMHHKDHTTPGYPSQGPKLPVIRVTWDRAMAFCQWLSEKTGQPFTLPTEAQWEWACRAGADTPFFYGGLDTDFSPYANLADLSIKLLAVNGINPQPIENPDKYADFIPKDARFDDHSRIMNDAGQYQPNAWGLYDMHGNAAEWTRSTYQPYPYVSTDGRDAPTAPGKKVVRGGSWRDRPKFARASYRLAYEPWQPVYNVGFRVICPVK